MKKNKQTKSQRIATGRKKTKLAKKKSARNKENKKKAVHNRMMFDHMLIKREKMIRDMYEQMKKKKAEEKESLGEELDVPVDTSSEQIVTLGDKNIIK